MASLLEHVMINKLSDELNEAITSVGGDTSSASGPKDYPGIIRDQLTLKGGTSEVGVLKEGDGITVKKISGGYQISSNSNSILISDLNIPHNVDNDSNIDIIPAGTTIQETFEKLFGDILPTLPSIISGDVIKASIDGTDNYKNPNFPGIGIKSGLEPQELYIRIFIASQQEPIYINCSQLGGSIATIEYQGETTNTIKVEVDNTNHIISAEIVGLGDGVINENNLSTSLLQKLQPQTLDEGEAENMFDDIFGV